MDGMKNSQALLILIDDLELDKTYPDEIMIMLNATRTAMAIAETDGADAAAKWCRENH